MEEWIFETEETMNSIDFSVANPIYDGVKKCFFYDIFNDLYKLLLFFFENRKYLKNHMMTACEMKRLIAAVISPLFLLLIKIF